jgi:hypothetical protein
VAYERFQYVLAHWSSSRRADDGGLKCPEISRNVCAYYKRDRLVLIRIPNTSTSNYLSDYQYVMTNDDCVSRLGIETETVQI